MMEEKPQKIMKRISFDEYLELDDKVTSRDISIPTIVPNKYFKDKRDGCIEHDVAKRTDVFGGVGPFDTYRVYCISDDNTFSTKGFEIGLKVIKEKNQTLYVMVEDKLIENSIEKIFRNDERDFVMVLKI